ncbi:hypothetical protein HOP50_04g29900 [Chloropicon primus]|uniref:Uncharacterized protein n=1 Tax=Chloropicon primus TaxID=1764295 RepID=A0A5B8MM88_9CHLO|nr:hypothetical protein A3770_04p29900 [Chloropicon primus]UPQ99682.1 hypothetical protein HOP50_04g29900 [Chloropicon primus]|eukprot:QDZ20472.1 hypothetical protein A3770_04p29900 [Chloropicon primus]
MSMGSLLCEKRLYNVESVETAALDVQVVGVDFPTVPFISGEVEKLEYNLPPKWEKRRLQALAKKARLELAKPRPKTSPYRTKSLGRRLKDNNRGKETLAYVAEKDRATSERNLLKCSRVSLTIQKERESLTTPMQKNPRLTTPSRRERALSMEAITRERPSTSHPALGRSVPSVSMELPDQSSSQGKGSDSPRVRSHSAKPGSGNSHIIHNLPKAKQTYQKPTQKTYKTRTSQYAERVKAVRKLQIQSHNELSERLATLNMDLSMKDVSTKERNRPWLLYQQRQQQENNMHGPAKKETPPAFLPNSPMSKSAVCR